MTENQETKKCPFCGEDILAVAIKCKHCGSDLSQAIAQAAVGELRGKVKDTIQQYVSEHRPEKAKGLFISPEIPTDKLDKAKSKYAQRIGPDETPMVLYEKATIVGIMVCGFVLTDKRFHYFGINDYGKIGGDSRKGVFDLHQIQSLTFAKGSFALNGLTSDNSDLIPLFFELNKPTEAFLNGLFAHIIGLLQDLGTNVQRSQPSSPPPNASTPQARSAIASANPLEAGEKKKPGCFKIGCAIVIIIGALAALILGLMM